MTSMFGTYLGLCDFVWTKFGQDRMFKSYQIALLKNCVQYLKIHNNSNDDVIMPSLHIEHIYYLPTKFHDDQPMPSMCFKNCIFDDVMITSRYFCIYSVHFCCILKTYKKEIRKYLVSFARYR